MFFIEGGRKLEGPKNKGSKVFTFSELCLNFLISRLRDRSVAVVYSSATVRCWVRCNILHMLRISH